MKQLILILSFTFLFIPNSYAQENTDFWEGGWGPFGVSLNDFVEIGNNEYVFATQKGIFKGGLEGNLIKVESDGLIQDNYTAVFVDSEGTIWAGANHFNIGMQSTLAKSEDDGESWTSIDEVNVAISDFLEDEEGNIYIGAIYYKGIWKKAADSDEWVNISDDAGGLSVTELFASSDGLILAGTQSGTFYMESDGETWTKIDGLSASSFVEYKDSIYAATRQGVFKSANGKDYEITAHTDNTTHLAVIGDELFAGDGRSFVKTSDHLGNATNVGNRINADKLKESGGNIYAYSDGLHEYDSDSDTWVKKLFDYNSEAFVFMPSGGMVISAGSAILHSGEWGEPWDDISSDDKMGDGTLAVTTSGALFTISDWEIYKTSDLENWEEVDLPDARAQQITTDNNGNLLVLTNNRQLLSTNDDGNSWSTIMEFEEEFSPDGFATVEDEIFVFHRNGPVKFSPDKGETVEDWIPDTEVINTAFTGVTKLSNGSYVFASNGRGIYVTEDGSSFEQRNEGLWQTSVRTVYAVNDTVYAPYGSGVYISADSAQSWSRLNRGLTDHNGYNDIIINPLDGKLYILDGMYGVFRSTSSLTTPTSTGSEGTGTETNTELLIPESMTLKQNYPNPFNPNTTIAFEVSMNGYTTLNIYNMLGQLVETLVSEQLTAGTYELNYDASSLSSGLYIYRLSQNEQVSSRKFTLIK